MSELVLYEFENGVATLTLNRREVLNALTDELLTDLAQHLDEAAGDSAVRAVVITGAGRGFCAGQDLAGVRSADGEAAQTDYRQVLMPHHRVARAIRTHPKPVVAAVNGVAAGAGFSIVCSCDLRIAADSARFTAAFSKIGLVPDAGLSYTLPRLVGVARALEIFFFSDMVSAEEALSMGLVNKVVPADELSAAAREFAGRLASGPTRAFALTKQLVDYALSQSFEDLLRKEAELQAEAGATEDARAAVQAFLDKQPAEFSGR
jgi:2-(1,2-epoxy-1,2-dihydrophenyl)acetyl-CoA isomerase